MKIAGVLVILILLNISSAVSQDYRVSGKLIDAKTNKPLSFGTIKLLNSNYSTTANNNGEFILHLNNGNHQLTASYIGYFSETVDVTVNDKDEERNIYLQPSEILTEEIQVFGEDPAYEIIRKAVKYKKEFKTKLNEYDYNAFTKYVIRSNMNSSFQNNTFYDSSTGKMEYGIFGLLESETKGFVKKPDIEKQIVISKKESANISRGFAIPFIVNFYDEDIDFDEIKIPTPLSDNTFDEYEFKLKGINYIDSMKIYKIQVINQSENVPQFKGLIYILDSTFSLMKVNLSTNNAANMRGIDMLNFNQKFTEFKDKSNSIFWLPTDVEIFAEGSFAGLFKFKGEVFTIVSNYNINQSAPSGTFDEFIVKVMPDAEKDSLYWKNNQRIKNTDEELTAYSKIKKTSEEKSSSISISPFGLRIGKYISSNSIDYYNFNRVEGSSLRFNLNYSKDFGRYNAYGFYGYGFSDKKLKYELSGSMSLLKDRSLQLKAGIFNRLRTLSSLPTAFDDAYNIYESFINKNDRYDYFYSSGLNFSISKKIIPQFSLGINYFEALRKSAKNNSNFSILKKSGDYRINPRINDDFNRTIGTFIRIDPNEYKAIDWGDGDISRFGITSFPVIDFSYTNSSKKLLSTFDFRTYSARLSGRNYVNRFIRVTYQLGGFLLNGEVPYQNLAYLRTFEDGSNPMIFEAAKYQQFLGDKFYYFNFENDFGKLFWGNIPFLKELDLIAVFNIGRTEISDKNRMLSSFNTYESTDGYYTEAGFRIRNILSLINLNFTWRLTNRRPGENFNFYFSLTGF